MAKRMTQGETDQKLKQTDGPDADRMEPKRAKKAKRGAKKPVITYDFKHPSRVSKDQTRTLGESSLEPVSDDVVFALEYDAVGSGLRHCVCRSDDVRRGHRVDV